MLNLNTLNNLVASSVFTKNDTTSKMTKENIGRGFLSRLNAVCDGYNSVLSFLNSNFDFLIKNASKTTERSSTDTYYYIGKNLKSHYDEFDIRLTVRNGVIIGISGIESVNKANVIELGIEDRYYSCGLFLDKNLEEYMSNLSNDAFYNHSSNIERFDKWLEEAEYYYLTHLPMMLELCLKHIKQKIDMENSLINKLSDTKTKKIVRKVTIEITEEEV